MQDSPLINKSKQFALQTIKICNQIKNSKKETVITNQLIRSEQVLARISVKRFSVIVKPTSRQNYKLP